MTIRIYTKRFTVTPDAIDRQGHVNNLAYVAWMQDVAIEHSTAAGWPMDRYLAIGAGWVVRSHFVEYLRPALAGDRLAVHTWVPEFTRRSTPRRYLFVRERASEVVARAEPAECSWTSRRDGAGPFRTGSPRILRGGGRAGCGGPPA
jgi:acyl-CoA thioester hydrolase